MKLNPLEFSLLLWVFISTIAAAKGFTTTSSTNPATLTTGKMAATGDTSAPHPFCLLPGDPSLMLTTNVDLGAKKLEVMKGKQEFSDDASLSPS